MLFKFSKQLLRAKCKAVWGNQLHNTLSALWGVRSWVRNVLIKLATGTSRTV